jgi:hypothetical protein
MRRKKCMSEEERAAVLLMALSSGVIYASWGGNDDRFVSPSWFLPLQTEI